MNRVLITFKNNCFLKNNCMIIHTDKSLKSIERTIDENSLVNNYYDKVLNENEEIINATKELKEINSDFLLID